MNPQLKNDLVCEVLTQIIETVTTFSEAFRSIVLTKDLSVQDTADIWNEIDLRIMPDYWIQIEERMAG
jgi:hypothetical protein